MLKDTLRAKEEDKQQLKLIKKNDTQELKLNTKQRRQITQNKAGHRRMAWMEFQKKLKIKDEQQLQLTQIKNQMHTDKNRNNKHAKQKIFNKQKLKVEKLKT